jgi:hypothetical protein
VNLSEFHRRGSCGSKPGAELLGTVRLDTYTFRYGVPNDRPSEVDRNRTALDYLRNGEYASSVATFRIARAFRQNFFTV